jgi:hypothetical protein
MRSVVTFVAAWLLLVGTVAPAFAHHSLAAEFDESRSVTLKGVISKVEWINPHVYLQVDVPDTAGKITTWAVETFPPATLRRGGLTKEKLGLGQNVTLLAYQARKGSELAFLRKITFQDGQEIIIWLGDINQASSVK